MATFELLLFKQNFLVVRLLSLHRGLPFICVVKYKPNIKQNTYHKCKL